MLTIEQLFDQHIAARTEDERLVLLSLIAESLVKSPRPQQSIKRKPSAKRKRRSALDVLHEAPGHQLFQTASEVDTYLEQERAA
jgi:hypothetical protein